MTIHLPSLLLGVALPYTVPFAALAAMAFLRWRMRRRQARIERETLRYLGPVYRPRSGYELSAEGRRIFDQIMSGKLQ